MSWYTCKQSQSIVSLEEGIHSKTQIPIVFTKGYSYPIKTQLKQMGFRWYGIKKIWWIPKNNLTQEKIKMLQDLGVTTDISSPPQTTQEKQQPETRQDPVEKPIELTDKTTGMREYGPNFPVNPNIYETDIPVIVNGQEIILHAIFGREEKNYKKTLPVYKYTLKMDGETVINYEVKPKGRWTKRGPNYDEDAMIQRFIQKVPSMVDLKEKSRLYKHIIYMLELKKRDPEFASFLKQWDSQRYSKEGYSEFVKERLPSRTIHIDEYDQDFKIKFSIMGSLYLETDVDHKLAPREVTLLTVDIPSTTRDLDQFNQLIDKTIEGNIETITNKYIKYLQSFPFREEEAQQTESEMREIVRMIMNRHYDIPAVKQELQNRGFIRKKKRGEGWMVTKEAIDPGYSTSNTVDDYYGAIAYWLSRKKRRVSSWTEMMLTSTINQLVDIIKRYGYEIRYEEVNNYLESVVNQLFEDLFGTNAPRSRAEQFSDFYGNNQRGTSEQTQTVNIDNALQQFAQFASEHGINYQEAIDNPKTTYRQLVLKWHPDIHEDKEKANAVMSQLSSLYNQLPDNLKRACNWYKSFKVVQPFARSLEY